MRRPAAREKLPVAEGLKRSVPSSSFSSARDIEDRFSRIPGDKKAM